VSDGIAIVGMGARFPGAPDAPTYWENVLAGVDAITDAPPDRWDEVFYDPEAEAPDRVYVRRGGFIDTTAAFDPTEFGIMPVTVESAEPDQLIALQVASEAIADTVGGLPAGEGVAVVVGRGGYFTPGMARFDQRVRVAEQLAQTLKDLAPELSPDRVQEVKAAFQAQLGPARPEGAIDLVPNLAASRIANRLDLQGPAYTVDAACASSLIALDQAVAMLRSGRVDAAVVGGVHHCHDVAFWAVFSQLRALSPSQAIRPFDRAADGLLIGEGTGMVVIKRLADAERAGDRIYAVVEGTGVASDGKGASVMVPRVAGQLLALQRAWADAEQDPSTIGLVEAHGTATPVGDEAELTTLGRFFGGAPADGRPRAGVGSVKSMIGHAMPAAGIAGLIKAAYALHHGVLPPTLHVEDPHEAFQGTRFRPITEAEPWDAEPTHGVRRAAVNAFGFGGINAHVVLSTPSAATTPDLGTPAHRNGGSISPDPVAADMGTPAHRNGGSISPDRGDRVVLVAGDSLASLAAQLESDADGILGDRDDLASPAPVGSIRLAMVAPNEKRLSLAKKVVERGTAWRGRNDVWFSGPEGLLADPDAKTAFLFPGVEPTFAPNADDVAEHLGLAPLAHDTEGGLDLSRQGAAIVALGRLLHGALAELGVEPDLVGGHSIGEWNAMIAAGLIPADGVDDFIASVDLDAVEVPDLVFAALGCGADQALEAIDGLEHITVSHDNCPHQSVVCGTEAAVQQALDRLGEQRVLGQVLPFRSGFHSPLLEPYLAPALRDVERVPLADPHLPVWSATTVDEYPTDLDEVRTLVIRHLVEPVRFRELAQRLHAEGVRVFVQVGVGSISAFLDDSLKDADVLVVSAGSEDRAGLDQLRRTAAALWVEGADPDLARLAGPSSTGSTGSADVPVAGSNRRVDVPLGTPLIRLTGPRLDLAGSADTGIDPTNPVLAELDAALKEAADAGRAVAAAWGTGPTVPTVEAAPSSPAAPPEVTERTTSRVLDIESMPHLVDHAFNRQRDDWADLSDRFPVVPMTGTLELLREAAVDLVPGRLPVAVEDVRALRWLPVEPATEITVVAKRVAGDPDRVRVSIEGFSRGTVVLADEWPEPPPASDEPLGEVAPQGPTAAQLYDEHWLFHGPEFQGIRELGPMGPGGMTAAIECLPAPGAVLDAAGQLVGHWLAVRADTDRLALPRHLTGVRWFGPLPEPGTPLDVTMRVRHLDGEVISGDLELVGREGLLWCRIDGWEDHRFQTDELTWPIATEPETNVVAEPQPGGWVLVRERWRNTASRELSMRRYLVRAEREQYEAMTPNVQRQWLLGRIAAKDAVRLRAWAQAGERRDLFPAEVRVANDDDGAPLLQGVGAELHLSLAHTAWLGVALVHDGGPVGIDVERIEPRPERFDALVMSAAEQALLPAGRNEDEWRTRVWAAKEAAAKAARTGLEGNPKRWVLTALDGERLQVDGRWVQTTRFEEEHVVAWTEVPDGHEGSTA
jgi:acyl transferase domain-containing protein/phosphopantetheinyl transferase